MSRTLRIVAQAIRAGANAVAEVLDRAADEDSTPPPPLPKRRRVRGPIPPSGPVSEVDRARARKELIAHGLHTTKAPRNRND